MRREGVSLLLLVLLLLHGGMALAAASPQLPGPLSGEDEIYPFSLRYRKQVDEQIALTQLPAAAGLPAPPPTCELTPSLEGVPLTQPAGTDLLYLLMSLQW
jgi:hypothetical protein